MSTLFTSSFWSQRGYYVTEGLLITFLSLSLVITISFPLSSKIQSIFLFTVAIVGVLPVLWSISRAIREREITVDVLAGMALIFAIIGREWSSAIFVALMLSAARIMTHWNDVRTERNLTSLMRLRPEKARVKQDGIVREIAVEAIQVNDRVLCEVGSRIPIDGEIVLGEASIDESSLTGESLPVEKSIGQLVYSSTLIASGGLEVRATRVGRETTLERIITLVEQAHQDKPAISTAAQCFGKIYIISIFLLSSILWIWTKDLNLVLAVALVVCADDVAIAIPLAYVTAIGNAARRGIIIKGGRYLEALDQATTFIFDKTGTITRGELHIETVETVGLLSAGTILNYARQLGKRSKHPVARALARIADDAVEPLLVESKLAHFLEISGKGLSGTFDDKRLLIGRVALLEERHIVIDQEVHDRLQRIEAQGQSVVLVACNERVVGLFGIADEIRSGARETIAELRALGVSRIVMLTGDNASVAARVAKAVGIEEYHAALLPQEKLALVKKLTPEGVVSVMVGDGVNDAASLERATVGIAMGAIGYDAAVESANIVLMRDDIRRLPEIVQLARSLRGVVHQNFWIWGASNIVGLGLVFLGFIGPAGAAAYNFLSDFIPLLNSLKVVRMWFGRSE